YAVYDHPQTVPPTWGYSQDNSPMGSNDFRSTKRHINSAAVTYGSGVRVGIQSDGKQSLMAMLESDRVSVNVNDWYGGTNVGWGEWITNYGRGKQINPGDVLESTLHLQLKSGGGKQSEVKKTPTRGKRERRRKVPPKGGAYRGRHFS